MRSVVGDDGCMPPTIHTARLVLTPVSERDLAPLQAHWSDPRVARFLWDAQPVPAQTVAAVIGRSAQTFTDAGWGLWALRPTHHAPLIGVCGLSPFDPTPGIELLYSLTPYLLVPRPGHRSRHRRPRLRLRHPHPPRAPRHHRRRQPPLPPPPHPPQRHPHHPGPGRPPHLPLLPHPPPRPGYAPQRPL